MDQIELMVMSGKLQPGDRVPSVRQLASRFEVNPMTISKAYSLLEAKGILERERGKGMRINALQQSELNLETRLQQLTPLLLQVTAQVRQLNLPDQKVLALLKNLLENKQ